MTVSPRSRIILEVLALWLATNLLIRQVLWIREAAGLHEIVLALIPVAFMYAPVAVCHWRRVDPWSYPMHLPAFSDREAWREALWQAGLWIGAIAVPFVVGYHVWETRLFHHFPGDGIPDLPDALVGLGLGAIVGDADRLWALAAYLWPIVSAGVQLVGYHLFFAGLPEEIFYRGYLQSRLDEVFGTPWRVLGAPLGWGWLMTCVIFALGHDIVTLQWWHFAIFFPSLVFGWLRARTGGIVAGALFHAWCNITVSTLDALYGVGGG